MNECTSHNEAQNPIIPVLRSPQLQPLWKSRLKTALFLPLWCWLFVLAALPHLLQAHLLGSRSSFICLIVNFTGHHVPEAVNSSILKCLLSSHKALVVPRLVSDTNSGLTRVANGGSKNVRRANTHVLILGAIGPSLTFPSR